MNDKLFKLSEDGKVLIELIGGDDVTEVTIPESVTEIGRGAFDGCSSLTSITIPENVTEIGWRAFDGCSSLTSITIPENVTNIGGNAFAGCSSLESITLPKSVKVIGWRAFAGCSSLTQINILESVTKIEGRAFEGCSSLTSINVDSNNPYFASIDGVLFDKGKTILIKYPEGKEQNSYTIPDSVTEIGWRAFEGCSNLLEEDNGIKYIDCIAVEVTDKNRASYKLKEGTRFISECAFKGCESLTSINIPEGVTKIGERAFEGCSNLLEEDNGIRYIDCIAVEVTDKNRASYKLKEGTRFISEHAFGDCRSLTSINIPENVTEIGAGAFGGCSSLTFINISEGVTEIGSFAFEGCESLTSINIPESVTKIGESTFLMCRSLTSINIPEGVTKIENLAFAGCASLTSITFPEGVKEIGENAFAGCKSLTEINIPEGVTEIGESAFACCRSLTSINIPEGVTKIENLAFAGCASLTSITFPEGVKEIGENAFAGCKSLTEINIPEGVTEIGESAFACCRSLTSINIPENVTKIGGGAFVGCSNLTIICSENIANAIDTKSVKEVKVRKKVCCSELFSYFYFNNDKLTTKKEKALAMAQECCYGDFDLDYPEVYVTTEEKKLIVNIECNRADIERRIEEINKLLSDPENEGNLCNEKKYLEKLQKELGNRDSGTIEDEIIISGEYIRHYPGEKAKIFLYDINNQSPEQLVATYVHEMMHASYDYNHHVNNKYTSCVEEPLTEYGALRLLEDMDAQQGTSYFDAAYKSVKAKQYCPGICHYGFGAYLYDQHKKSQSPVNWERMMAAAKYGLCSENILQTEYGKRFSSGCYPHHDEATMAHELMCILRDGVQMAQKGRNAFICYCTYILGMQDDKTIGICSTLDGLLRQAPSVVGRGPLLRICDLYNQRDIKYVKAIRARKDLNNNFKDPLDLYIQFLEDTRPEVIALRKGTKF